MRNFSPEKLFAGREKALKNALELLEDSKVLFEAEKWARCFFIIQIATEELGKYGIIVTSTISAIHGSLDWKRFWKRFKDHKNKTRHLLVLEGLRRFIDDPLSELVNTEEDIKYAESQEYVKMQSLYCDVGNNGEFFAPSEIVTKRDCELSLQLLEHRVSLVSSFENKVAKEFPIGKMKKEDIDRFYKEIRISEIAPLGELLNP